jgi:hypothetical protein
VAGARLSLDGHRAVCLDLDAVIGRL